MASVGMTPATKLLAERGVRHILRPYPHDPAAESFALEVCQALGAPPAQVFKTLVVETGNRLVVGMVPADTQLDLKALAATVGSKKAALADPDKVRRATGYVLGGVSPLGQKQTLPTVIDESALDQATILVSGGRRGLQVELSPTELIELTNARVAPIARR